MFDITEVNERTAKRYIEHIMKLGYMASYFETKYQKNNSPRTRRCIGTLFKKSRDSILG